MIKHSSSSASACRCTYFVCLHLAKVNSASLILALVELLSRLIEYSDLSLQVTAKICYKKETEFDIVTKGHIRWSELSVTFGSVRAKFYCIHFLSCQGMFGPTSREVRGRGRQRIRSQEDKRTVGRRSRRKIRLRLHRKRTRRSSRMYCGRVSLNFRTC